MLNPIQQANRYDAFRRGCKPRTRVLIRDCDLCIIDDVLHLSTHPEIHPYHVMRLYASLGTVAGKQGLGLTIIDTMFDRTMYVSHPPATLAASEAI